MSYSAVATGASYSVHILDSPLVPATDIKAQIRFQGHAIKHLLLFTKLEQRSVHCSRATEVTSDLHGRSRSLE